MKLSMSIRQRKTSRGRGRRFLTSRDMAIIKQDEAVRNAQVKRGEVAPMPSFDICVCGCGVEGCAFPYARKG